MDCRRKVFFVFCVVAQITAVHSCKEDPIGILNDLDLRSPETISDYWDDGEGIVLNDDQLTDGWYRAVHNGWQYMLVDNNAIPDFVTCSTYRPIYLNGNHTPVDQLSGNPISAEVCIRDVLQSCISTYEIQIRMCDGEIQYKLMGTLWFSAYCFYKGFQLPEKETLAPAPENVNFGKVVVTPELYFKEAPNKGFIWNEPYIKFRCTFEQQEKHFYYVTWYIDKKKFGETMGPSRNLDSLKLNEDTLLARNISLGIQIQCGVSASSTINGLQTNVTFSAMYYAGIKVLNTTIYLDKERSAIVQMVSSVPIGCHYFGKRTAPCKTELKLFVNDGDPLSCEKGSLLNNIGPGDIPENQKCSKNIETLSKGDTWDPDTLFNFTIVTSDHNYNDEGRFILKLQFPKTLGHKIWKDYLFPDITVFVQNMEKYKSKICKSRNDPHMTTFDGYAYEQQFKGTFIMYQHQEKGIEVQQKVKQCNKYATCTCGVAVSAGQDIFMINRCSTKWFLGFTQCSDGGILQVVRVNDYRYKVFTPIGTRIELSLGSGEWMNLEIFLAPKDMGNVLGLCGLADGKTNNDLQHRNSKTVSPLGDFKVWDVIHHDFILSWRVAEDSKENLFNPTFKKRQPWKQQNGHYCVCRKKDVALCSSSQYLNCIKKDSITPIKCHIEGRRKRSTGNHSDKEIRRLLAFMARSGKRVKRQDKVTLSITSESIQLCKEKIDGSLAIKKYRNISANEDPDNIAAWCAFDIAASNDTLWADVHVEAVNEGVKNMIDLQPDYAANNTEEIDIFLKNTCPFNCTDRGVCSDEGKCLCFTYFHGPDCSIDERDALNIRDIQGDGECDLADGDDCECFYVRSDRIQENFTCAVNTSKILINGDMELVSTDTIKGGFEDIFTGICCVPENIKGFDDVFVAVYGVSISNNGYNFGNKENMYVFDSKCQVVEDIADNRKVFSLKNKCCFIDGYCYLDEEMAYSGCLGCNSSISQYNWTEYNPCQNGGICKDESNGYTCLCIEGYGGINCEYEVDECDSAPCQNGGNCTDEFNGYTCTCVGGFAGTHCEINIDECASQPCKNGGICKDQINQYECICQSGYEGRNCETEIDECSSNPCQNQGTCNDYVNGYTCTCALGFFGIQCQTNIDDCVSNPCQNRGTCVDGDDGRICTCLEGYQGVNCEININECSSASCLNGGTCVDALNMYTCDCAPGYTGLICEEEMNECSSNPCKNGGSCVDELNMFRCNCTSGYSGEICETDIDECLSNPCQNGGSCVDAENMYTCTCVTGFTDTLCETDIDECYTDPCLNGGSCVDAVNFYTCRCAAGYTGINCEAEINECYSAPCLNGGSCVDEVDSFKCNCTSGFTGDTCETDINECLSNPCQNGGRCVDAANMYTCACVAGFTGLECETDIIECSSAPCLNGGTCVDALNMYTCDCVAGYTGLNCEAEIDECASGPCLNGAKCVNEVNSFQCDCVSGYYGETCETEINECSSEPCLNGGSCVDEVNRFQCNCTSGYTGERCETDINECLTNPCQNGGSCVDAVNSYTCTCVAGFTGPECETDINECSSSPCFNGGICIDALNMYTCDCAAGYTGIHCEAEVNECSSGPCLNGGSCVNEVNRFQCNCASGYTGERCETDINECLSNPCQNGGSCVDAVNIYTCTCVAGFTGQECETEVNECSSEPCLNGGSCVNEVNRFQCHCASGYTGERCETDINECSSSPCLNGGICRDALNMYTCDCAAGYTGIHCEAEINECSSEPCLNGGSCVNEVNKFQCHCASGYTGERCETDINECLSNPCQNGGSCVDAVNMYTCTCVAGFTGQECETDINECTSSPCLNGGICIDALNMYTCDCAAGYTGIHCEAEVNECSSEPCLNGGSCVNEVNWFQCNCAPGYTGERCETDINECLSNPCQNSGSCIAAKTKCTCSYLTGFTGTKCQTDDKNERRTEIKECSSSPCLNGGICVDEVNGFHCNCASGFTGEMCETDIDECSSDPCQNGGICANGINGYTCTCAAGYRGNNCEADIDECSVNPCRNGGSCVDGLNKYTCTCVAGYEGEYCELDIDECSPNPCKNGGKCVDGINRYTCKCADGYEGKDCGSDIDECSPNPCQNGGSCIDSINHYICLCLRGYGGVNCDSRSISSSKISLVLPVTINHVLLSDSHIKQNIRAELIKHFQGKLGNSFKDVTILQLRYGSLIVDFIINYDSKSTAAIELAKATTELVSGEAKIELLNETVSATAVTIDDITVKTEALHEPGTLCKIYIAINGECTNDFECVDEEDSPACVPTKSKFGLTVLIVVIVCSMVSLIFVSAAICVYVRVYRVRHGKQMINTDFDTRKDEIQDCPPDHQT